MLFDEFLQYVKSNTHSNIRFCEVKDKSIICELDVEAPSKNNVGISKNEKIEFSFGDNENFPDVFSVRADFPKYLPHTNLRDDGKNWLCIIDVSPEEISHNISPFFIVERTIKWLNETANKTLHKNEQALEPYFCAKYAVIDEHRHLDIDEEKLVIAPLDLIKINNNIFKLKETNNHNKKNIYFAFGRNAIHGYIWRIPKNLSELNHILNNGIINILKKNNHILKNYHNFNIGVILKLCMHRTVGEPESNLNIFLYTNKQIKNINHKSAINNLFAITLDSFYIHVLGNKEQFYHSCFNKLPNKEHKGIIVGAGALGSQMISIFSRTGFGKFLLIDSDSILPHNIARHLVYLKEHIGLNKSKVVADIANEIRNSKDFEADITNIVHADKNELYKKINEFDFMIDLSTSISVERLLAIDIQHKTRMFTSFLNPTGTDLILLSEDKERTITSDKLEMQYYRYLCEQKCAEHLISPYKERYSRNSCRDVSSIINQENVALFSAIVAKAIRKKIEENDDNADIKIWHYDENFLDIKNISIKVGVWETYTKEVWKIHILSEVKEKLFQLRKNTMPNETGGVLIGHFDVKRKIVYIVALIKSPIDSIEMPNSYMRGVNGLEGEISEYIKYSQNNLCYIGEWHSHLKGTNPSENDIEQLKFLTQQMNVYSLPGLMLIVDEQNINIYMDENNHVK